MPSKFFSHDPETGITEKLHFEDGQQVMEATQDCEDIVKFNELMTGHLDKRADWWHVGRVPLSLCMKWAQESGTRVFSKDWQKIAHRKLNDPEYKKLNPNNIRL